MKLSTSDRGFFETVAQAAFTNPFTPGRKELDAALSGLPASRPPSEHLDAAIAVVHARVGKLEAAGAADVRQYNDEDRRLVVMALLFDVFHAFIEPLDSLIEQQVRSGTSSAHAPFANDVIEVLQRRGFSSEGTRHFISIFYQLRRAYYFIDRALVGRSASMLDLKRRLWTNVFTTDIVTYERFLWDRMEDFSTLLLGETGTGKGAAAAAIGRSGYIPFDEKKGAFAVSFMSGFVAIQLSQYPESLIESELFGHRKGAFTGAINDHDGVFARCSPHGAILLDEIGDASLPIQTKLLQVLQERTFSPVGSHEKLRFPGRVIAATNRPLDALRREGRFRDDFFYRLCSDVITVPPLRQRLQEHRAEREELIDHLLARLTGKSSPALVEQVSSALDASPGRHYEWPGNVRELEQAVRRILLTGRYEGDKPAAAPDLQAQLHAGIRDGNLSADDVLAAYCKLLHRRHGTYEAVAEVAGLDRRTAKKYILRN